MASAPLRLLIIGAHPDDADYHAGGLAALYRAAGHVVQMVSLTNGDAGHHQMRGPKLAERRRAEATAAAAVIGATYEVLSNHDGELQPSLENRRQVIRLIRSFRPDLVLTHRPNDYHPDHRYTGQLVCDAAYMMTVPPIVPDVPALAADPVMAYMPDDFQKPYPFRPDVFIDVTPVFGQIIAMLDCHESQFYEWLAYHAGRLDQVPRDPAARHDWLAAWIGPRLRALADRHRRQLQEQYGPERAARIEYLEAFEVCEYGASLDEVVRQRLFGFLP
jgi:LmbE family N-acetylglucosaminyl deacetylase